MVTFGMNYRLQILKVGLDLNRFEMILRRFYYENLDYWR